MKIRDLSSKSGRDKQAVDIIKYFCGYPGEVEFLPVVQGNINDTYIADVDGKKIVVQRINPRVFPHPKKVVENFVKISGHIQQQLISKGQGVFPEIVVTPTGKYYVEDPHGGIWRAQKYIENAEVYEKLNSPEQAVQVGKCLAQFHLLFEGMSPTALEVTVPGFHNLPQYLENYDNALKRWSKKISEKINRCIDFVRNGRSYAFTVEGARQRGELVESVTHGDPKVANILFHRLSGDALTLIDFDTVGPGLHLYDLGDCLRSCCCTVDENGEAGTAHCDVAMVAAVLQGYCRERRLSSSEKIYIFSSFYLLTFELGLRFFTDFLQNNQYFKVVNRGDNLHRAIVQFELAASIWQQKDAIDRHIKKLDNHTKSGQNSK